MQRIQGYCVRCQDTRELGDLKQILRSGFPTVEGTCVACGGQVFVLGAVVPAPPDETTEA